MLNRRKHLKKIISLAFAVAALSVVLAGCSKGEEAGTTAPAEGSTNTAPTGTNTPTTPN